MSSVVKKGARFQPKVRKQPLKRKIVPPVTPVSTQGDEVQSTKDEHPIPQKEANSEVITPENTQVKGYDGISTHATDNIAEETPLSALVKFDFKLNEKAQDITEDTAIAPDIAVSSGDEIDNEYRGNDLFDSNFSDISKKVRRQSSINKQRLSGITPSIIRHRSSSVSMHPHPISTNAHSEDVNTSPVKIGIPQAKVAKRRRSSVRRKRNLIFGSSRAASISELSNLVTIQQGERSENEEVERLKDIGLDDGSRKGVAIEPPSSTKEPSPALVINREKIMQIIDTEGKATKNDEEKDEDTLRRRSSRLTSKKQLFVDDNGEVEGNAGGKSAASRKFKKEGILESNSMISPSDKSVKQEDVLEKIQIQSPGTKYKHAITSVKQLSKDLRKVDPEDLDQITIEEEKMVMSELCLPEIYFGKLGSRYLQVIEGKKHIEKQKQERRNARRRARDEKKSLEEITGENDEPSVKKDILADSFMAPKPASTLQLKIVGDSITLDQDSTNVDRHANVSLIDRDREEANPFNNPITSSSYSKRKYTDRWQASEIDQFYKALSNWGTDFTLIAQIFPHRTRKQIKLKFNLEEKKHPEIVELALRRQLPADFNKYCDDANKSFKTLEEYNHELKELRLKHDQDMELYRIDRERAKKEDQEEARNKEIKKRMGATPLSRSNKKLRDNEVVLGSIDDKKRQKLENPK